MVTSLRFLFTILLVFPVFFLFAQPGDRDLRKYGCHFSNGKTPPVFFYDMERNASCGSNARSDSIDVLNYCIQIDLTNFTQQIIRATCEITFTTRKDGIGSIPLDLLALSVDSVTSQGFPLNYDYDELLLDVRLQAPVNAGDTLQVIVHYQGHPKADNYWGGFVFDSGIAYNLGIGLTSNPFSMGRSWHPCFDNFVERATYDISIITNEGRKGYAVGEFLGETILDGGETLRQYRMPLPLPTYLVGVAASNYAEIHQNHTGVHGELPILLVGKPADTTKIKSAFTHLGDAVDALEAWFGPYIWGQAGYVMTIDGAMEHATLIAYPISIIGNGPTFGMNRLMAHELAHHWWGNITLMSCPEDMWIKEGNAEYGAHLFFEHLNGTDYFRDIVRENHYDVLKNAHLDDGAYLPLSGLPYQNTYGSHTYYKGAAVMHNLRGYLGDSLFQYGMRSILNNNLFEAVDAEQFRDQLTAETGMDMASFFDDWIYSPGFAMFELDSVKLEPADVPEYWLARIYVQQKLHKAPHFYTNVPLEITFYDKNWNTYTTFFIASGEYSEAMVTVPFEPVWQILNDNNRLNMARMQDKAFVKEPGNLSLSYCDLVNPTALKVPDSALVSFIHYWGGADPAGPEQPGVRLSGTHYWRYGGMLPPGFKARVTLAYNGSGINNFDYDLAHTGEDSLILAWRPKPGIPWEHYPYYKKTIFTVNDGKGFMRIDTLLPGDYAFAKGELPLVTALHEACEEQIEMNIYPNPVPESFVVQGNVTISTPVTLTLFDTMGRLLRWEKVQINAGELFHRMEVSGLPPGIYWLKVASTDRAIQVIEKIIKT
jgi:aminopeptidase N